MRFSICLFAATLFCLFAATLFAACGGEVADGAVDGPAVFAARCTMCHGPAGKPDAAMVARLGVRDLTASEFRARVTATLVEHQVRAGSQNKLMPSFEGAISDAQIRAVAAWVAAPAFVGK